MSTTSVGSALLYPERQRCFKCRRCFAFQVINRLYCSYECAGMVDANFIPIAQLPRQCYSRIGGKERPKVFYNTPEEAASAALLHRGKSGYHCRLHGGWHIGADKSAEREIAATP